MYGSRFVVRHAGIPLGFFQNSYRLDGTGVNHRRQSTGMEADHRTTPVRPVCHHAVGTDGNLPAARLQKDPAERYPGIQLPASKHVGQD